MISRAVSCCKGCMVVMQLSKDAGNRRDGVGWWVEDCDPEPPGRLGQLPSEWLCRPREGKYGRGTAIASLIEFVEIRVCRLRRDKHECTLRTGSTGFSGGQMM